MTEYEHRARVALEMALFGQCDTNNLRPIDEVARGASRLRESSDRAYRAIAEMRRLARRIGEYDVLAEQVPDTKEPSSD